MKLRDLLPKAEETCGQIGKLVTPPSVQEFVEAHDTLPLVEARVVTNNVAVARRGTVSDVLEARADAFITAIEAGERPNEVARRLGTTAREIVKDPIVQMGLQELLKSYTLTAEERRRLVRAKSNKIALEGDDRAAIQALKIIAADPEVGLEGSKITTAVQFNVEHLQNVLNTVPEVPGLEDPK